MITIKQLIEKLNDYNQDLFIALVHKSGTPEASLSDLTEVVLAVHEHNGIKTKMLLIVDENTRLRPTSPSAPELQEIGDL